MDFQFSEEQSAIRDAARRFARDRLAPGYLDREQGGAMPRELIAETGAMGLIGSDLPEELGGLGSSSVTTGVVIEEISYADLNFGYLNVLGSLNGIILSRHGQPELAQEIVPKICAGEAVVCLGLTEPSGGSDAAALKTKATRRGGDYLLNGEKTSISMADQADYAVVFARTGTAEQRARGVTAFLVPMTAEGVSCGRFDDVGSNQVGRGSIFFDDVVVPETSRIGEEGMGFKQVMQGFDFSRALIALQVLAAARASMDETWALIQERQAFGQKLSAFQDITHPLAGHETLLEAARLLSYKALWLRDNDLPHTAEAAMVKWWGPAVAFDAIHDCLLTHGHGGYSRDLPHQQRLRDALGLQIGDGTKQIQKMIIARDRLKRWAR